MRKILALLSILLVATLVLAGCGFSSWQDEEPLKEIKSIKRITDETTGEVFLQVIYSDDTTSEKFSLPVGVSVTGVKSSHSSKDRQTTVTFEFSDGKTQTSFTIPDGADGTKVVDVKIETDSNNTPYLYFYFSDGTQSDGVDISVLKGENGKDGVDGADGKDGSAWLFGKGAPKDDAQSGEPAEGEEPNEGEETDGSAAESSAKTGDYYLNTETYQVYVKQSDGTWELLGCLKSSDITLGYTDAGSDLGALEIIFTDYDENGKPVEREPIRIYSSAVKSMNVVYNKTSGMYEYQITVSMVDGTEKTLETIKVQRPSTWFYGKGSPVDGQGVLKDVATFDGDFYYETTQSEIYVKENGDWKRVITLEPSDQETCKITFYPEGGTLSGDLNDYPSTDGVDVMIKKNDGGDKVLSVEVTLKKGQCYPVGTAPIPIPEKEGYVFKGWYRQKNINVNSAPFSDMVPVYEDIALYAVWEEVTPA